VVWGARVGWAAAGATAIALLQVPAAGSLEPGAFLPMLALVAGAALGLGVLGANLAISLHPRTDHAQRLFSLWVGLALAGSIMIPLLGWGVLAAAVAHSLRRVRRWRHPEVEA
jgi:hypothetical protein